MECLHLHKLHTNLFLFMKVYTFKTSVGNADIYTIKRTSCYILGYLHIRVTLSTEKWGLVLAYIKNSLSVVAAITNTQ